MLLQVCARTFKLSEKLHILGVIIDRKMYFKFHINGTLVIKQVKCLGFQLVD